MTSSSKQNGFLPLELRPWPPNALSYIGRVYPFKRGTPPYLNREFSKGSAIPQIREVDLADPETRTLGSRVRFASSVMTMSLTRKHGVFDRECDSPRQGDRSRSRGEQGVYPCCRRLKPFHVPTIGMTILFCRCASEMYQDESYRRKRDQPRVHNTCIAAAMRIQPHIARRDQPRHRLTTHSFTATSSSAVEHLHDSFTIPPDFAYKSIVQQICPNISE